MSDGPQRSPSGIWNLHALVESGAAIGEQPAAGAPPRTEPAGNEPVPEPAARISPGPAAAAPGPATAAAPGDLPAPARPDRVTPLQIPSPGPGWRAPRLRPLRLGASRAARRPGSVRGYVYGAAGLLCAMLAAGVVIVLRSHDTAPTAPPANQNAGQFTPAPPGASTGRYAEPPPPSPTDLASPTPSATEDREAAALDTLKSLREQDESTVTFSGQYAAQLASKVVGIVDPLQTAANGSHTFYASDILAEHLALRQGDNLGATVVLVLSTDYGKGQLYQGQPLWITFALGEFGSAAAVRSWCAERFPQLDAAALTDQCAARRLEPRQ